MNHTNQYRAEKQQIAHPDPAESSHVVERAVATSPGRPRDAHRDRAAWIVLIIGLFGIAWMVLMRDVHVGLPAQVTSTPKAAARGAEGRDSGIPEVRSPIPSAGSDGT